MSVLILNDHDVSQLISFEEAIPVVEASFRKISLDEAMAIPRNRCKTDHVVLHTQSAAAKTLNAIGVNTLTTGNFGSQSKLFFFDSKLGHLTAIVDASWIMQIRGGATGAVAVKKLSNANSKSIAMIGSGKQARAQLTAISYVRKLEMCHVYSPNRQHAEKFAQEMAEQLHLKIIVSESVEKAVRNMDIVVTATTAREAFLQGDWLAEGCHVNLFGAIFTSCAEADIGVFKNAQLISIDSKEQGKLEAGDFVAPIREKIFEWADVYELPHIITGRYPGRENTKDRTVFKALGLGLQDLAIAAKVIEKAKLSGIGKQIEI